MGKAGDKEVARKGLVGSVTSSRSDDTDQGSGVLAQASWTAERTLRVPLCLGKASFVRRRGEVVLCVCGRRAQGGRRLTGSCRLQFGRRWSPPSEGGPCAEQAVHECGTVECLRTFSKSLLCSSRGTFGSPVRYLLLSFLISESSPSCQTPASTQGQGRLPPVRVLPSRPGKCR